MSFHACKQIYTCLHAGTRRGPKTHAHIHVQKKNHVHVFKHACTSVHPYVHAHPLTCPYANISVRIIMHRSMHRCMHGPTRLPVTACLPARAPACPAGYAHACVHVHPEWVVERLDEFTDGEVGHNEERCRSDRKTLRSNIICSQVGRGHRCVGHGMPGHDGRGHYAWKQPNV